MTQVNEASSSTVMYRSAYAAVIFHNVCEMYPADAHVECSYTITKDIVPSTRDWIGLYKVGWMSPNDYYYYEWAPYPKDYKDGTECQSEILFQAHNLPKDDGEFYQFCYVSRSGQIRGASTPFQFKKPSATDFVEVEDDESDMLIVRSKTKYLEENLKEANHAKDGLVLQKVQLEELNKELVKEVQELRCQLEMKIKLSEGLSIKLKEAQQELEANNKNTSDLIVVNDELTSKIQELKKEKIDSDATILELENSIKDLEKVITVLKNEKDEADGKNKMFEEETEMLKHDLMKCEGDISHHVSNIKNLQKDIEEKKGFIAACQMEIAQLKKSLHDETLEKERKTASAMDNTEKLQETLRNTEDKLQAAVRVKELMCNELSISTTANDELNKILQSIKMENLELKKTVERMETEFSKESEVLIRENDGLNRDINNVVQEKEELQKKLSELNEKKIEEDVTNGAMHALTIVNDELKKRIKIMRNELEKTRSEMKTVMMTKKELSRENEDLKERINMCSEEYRTLYKENVKLQKKKSKSSKTKIERTGGSEIKTDETSSTLETSQTESESKEEPSKLQKYKKMYQEEKMRHQSLLNEYDEELKKKDIEINTLRATITSRPNALEHRLMSCESYLAEKDKMIEELNSKLREIQRESTSHVLKFTQRKSEGFRRHNSCHSENWQSNMGTSKYMATRPPHIYPLIPPTVKNGPDHLSDSDNSEIGLPQPITPTIMPSAKVAAIKASLHPYSDDQTELNFVDAPTDFERTVPTAPGVDIEEDKFEDASGVGMKTCPNCDKSFSPDISEHEFERHILAHSGRICPICNEIADSSTSDNDFQYHVNCCLDKDKY